MIALMRAGGAWVPINYRNAADANVEFMNYAEVRWLFYHSSFSDQANELRKRVPTLRHLVCIDADANGDLSLDQLMKKGIGGAQKKWGDPRGNPERLVGLVPTGSRDPYALRRAAQGVVKILVEGEVKIPVIDLLKNNEQLIAFFEDRVRFYFKDVRGFKYDEVNAAMAAGWSDLKDLESRLVRIQRLRPTPDFEPLAASFKRIRNILEQANFNQPIEFNPGLLEPGPEKDLHEEYLRIAGQPIENVISRLRPKVDLFFDKVLVNAPQPEVRQNRLMLLFELRNEFSKVADFSEIVTNS